MSVNGKVAPEIEKPAPVNVVELMITGAVPVEERVMDWDVAVPTATLAKLSGEVFTLRVGTAAFNCRANVFVTPPALAMIVAV